jgi:hypothetical protein
MLPKQGEDMTQTRLTKIVTALQLNPPEPRESHPGANRASGTAIPPPHPPDLIPYSATDLKYLWTMWDEARRPNHPIRRCRLTYAGALGIILTGCLIQRMGLSYSAPLGVILMVAGSLAGAWSCLKALRHQRDSGPWG